MKFLKKLFKKNEVQEEIINEIQPNLMDPEINLMADDPLSKIISEPIIEKEPEIIETPIITEKQLVTDLPKIKKEKVKEEVKLQNAFNIPMQKPSAEVLDIDESENVNLQRTQKFCPECKTPNDVLNKFCVSCGYNFK